MKRREMEGVTPTNVDKLGPEHFPKDRLTIGLFGPGHGEAVVVGLPDGRVGVLDGCAEERDPVLELLCAMDDVRPDFRLAFVGLTHPHADHFAGLGRLMERFQGKIKSCWESHLCQRHAKSLLRLLELTEHPAEIATPKRSLERVLAQMEKFARGPDDYWTFSDGKILLEEADVGGHRLQVLGCGPPDADTRQVTLDLAAAAQALATGAADRGGPDPNTASGAVLVQWGAARALLGGDLLAKNDRFRGWSGVNSHSGLRNGRVQVVKAAHHASVGAHDDELWTQMSPELVLVSPFKEALTARNGANNPPRPEQIALLGAGSVVAITSPPRWRGSPGTPRGNRGGAPPGDTGERNPALGVTAPARSHAALRNAIAVSMDSSGRVVALTLAGEADIYQI